MDYKSQKELREELKWYKETSIFIGRDGMPSMLVMFTGIFPTWIYRKLVIYLLQRKIK